MKKKSLKTSRSISTHPGLRYTTCHMIVNYGTDIDLHFRVLQESIIKPLVKTKFLCGSYIYSSVMSSILLVVKSLSEGIAQEMKPTIDCPGIAFCKSKLTVGLDCVEVKYFFVCLISWHHWLRTHLAFHRKRLNINPRPCIPIFITQTCRGGVSLQSQRPQCSPTKN